MPGDDVLLELKPGDVLVVGPQGRLLIAILEDGTVVNEVIGCTMFRSTARNTALTELRNMVFDEFDDTGTRRVAPGEDACG